MPQQHPQQDPEDFENHYGNEGSPGMDEQYMEDGDPNEFEDGVYGGSISNALAGQRNQRKRAQEDVKMLANRIALLKLEE